MNKKRSRFIALFTALTLVASLYHVQPVRAAETVITEAAEVTAARTAKTLEATAKAAEIQKYGNVVLSLTCDEIKAAGYVYGDTVKVKFLGQTLKLPFVSNYSDVDSGKPAILARSGDPYVLLAINMGDFATKYGIAVKTVFEDNTFKWDYAEGITGPVSFTISLKKAGGYYEEFVLHQLSYSNERTDYPKLDDEEYANFRPIKTTGIGEGILYRTSSPINPKNNRNTYADAALKKAGVTVIVNLADDEETARGYAGFDSSYYSTTTFTTLNMPVSFSSDEFKDKLAKGLKFMAKNPGIYAIHCTEGKDRAGFVSAILECLMGASYDEVIEDYMTTFYNYYGVKKGDKRYDAIVSSNIAKSLKKAFTFDKKDKDLDLKSANLASRAKKYLKSIGLTNSEIKALKKNLSQSADIGTVDTKATILSSWNDDAPAKKELVSYMESITNKASRDYIPVERRIAVFDLDGTLYCETDPNYFDHLLLEYRVLKDEDYKDKASEFEKKVANDVVVMNETGVQAQNMEVNHGTAVASSFKGFTPDEFYDYIAEFKKTPMVSYNGMTLGEAFYVPMLQIVEYLEANGFTVYVVSGTDRFIVRGLLKDSKLDIPFNHIIGSDETLVAPDQGDTDGLEYVYDDNDKLVFGGDFIVKNLKMNKVTVIAQEIGVQPVLSFGNSTGDSSMAEYVTTNNQYKSLAFMLCCDDTVRENGNEAKAEKMRTLCGEYNWVPVSMKNDWKTIYGEGVTRK
ncbi:MAG: tyrosine-protein phosphatase [Lachnospiraceae bacterium]|nr:tyrosine-protein phosphatase [Lachnospiraceae bacterium]